MRFQDKKLLSEMAKLPCEACGLYKNNAAHHIVTRARNGGDYPFNLMTLCFFDHREWHDRGPAFMFKKYPHLIKNITDRGFEILEAFGKVILTRGENEES